MSTWGIRKMRKKCLQSQQIVNWLSQQTVKSYSLIIRFPMGLHVPTTWTSFALPTLSFIHAGLESWLLLRRASRCCYIIWHENRNGMRTFFHFPFHLLKLLGGIVSFHFHFHLLKFMHQNIFYHLCIIDIKGVVR